MHEDLNLDRFDEDFSARMSGEEWRRIISVRDHPRYLEGVALYDDIVPGLFAGNIVLNKVVNEYWRFQTIVYTLHLYDTADPDDPTTGLTLTRLQNLCVQYKIASAGGVTAFVGLMMVAGFLQRIPSPRDRRVIHLAPTAKFIKIVEEWNARVLRSIDEIMPEGGLEKSHAAHPRFGWDMRKRSAENLLAGWKPLDPFPEVMHFVSRHGGWMLLCHCDLVMLRNGNRSKILPVSVDLAEFGRNFGVSRTHLRRMLEGAHEMGLLDAPPRNGSHILMSPKLFMACMTAKASEISNYWLCACEVQERLRTPG